MRPPISSVETAEGFIRLGPTAPACPVLISVPHAGRDYPPELLEMSRVPRARLEALEDRYADLLVDEAVAAGATAFIARRPRCWIDLNRDEREIDPTMIDPRPRAHDVILSTKVRGGLGLVPRRMAGVSEIWARRLDAEELEARILRDHRPWHAAIASTLEEARRRFGVALLIDCHSMPQLPAHGGGQPPRIVLGDRHGRTAPPFLMDRLTRIAEEHGFPCARNSPYAGGHTLDRQAHPARGIHAIQIEVDRSTYLAPDLRGPGEGLPRMRALIAEMVAAMVEELSAPLARAAE
ncbi:MAG: N-formylglutamate amidohydrolase [Sphingomonas sp.]|nr:N-formylglutamate amidohydrolase [Sphingomonas sp.]MDX3885844.1 N-formylglutamate amidohydrolase [Sphingomonas sp.]